MEFESSSYYLIKENFEKGYLEGLEEGRKEGRLEVSMNTIRNMMKNSIFKTFDAALDGIGITDETDRQLIKDTLSSEGISG